MFLFLNWILGAKKSKLTTSTMPIQHKDNTLTSNNISIFIQVLCWFIQELISTLNKVKHSGSSLCIMLPEFMLNVINQWWYRLLYSIKYMQCHSYPSIPSLFFTVFLWEFGLDTFENCTNIDKFHCGKCCTMKQYVLWP